MKGFTPWPGMVSVMFILLPTATSLLLPLSLPCLFSTVLFFMQQRQRRRTSSTAADSVAYAVDVITHLHASIFVVKH